MQPLRGAGADEHAALLRGELGAAAEQLLGRREEEGVRRCAEVHLNQPQRRRRTASRLLHFSAGRGAGDPRRR